MNKLHSFKALILLAFELSIVNCPLSIIAQPIAGVLDQTFGNAGKITVSPGPQYRVNCVDVKIQPDQKIVVLSQVDSGTSNNLWLLRRYLVSRHLPDGRLDSTFGVNGRYFWPRPYKRLPMDILLQPDGKILVSCMAWGGGGYNNSFSLARLTANGQLDPTWAAGVGDVLTWFVSSNIAADAKPTALFLLPNGKVLQAGIWTDGSGYMFASVRRNADGSIDSTYGVSGKSMQGISSVGVVYIDQSREATYVMLSNQKIVGRAPYTSVRVNPNGVIDSTYGTNGAVNTGGLEYGACMLLPNGQMMFGGNPCGMFVNRYNANGKFDSTYGYVQIDHVDTCAYYGTSTADFVSLPNGQFISAQHSGMGNQSAMAKFKSNGTIDSAFGVRGRMRGVQYNGAIAVQADGKIVTADTTGIVARYENHQANYNALDFITFIDRNHNGIKDIGDPWYTNATATVIKPGDTIRETSSTGTFEVLTDTGTYTTKISSGSPYYTPQPVSHTTSHPTYYNDDNFEFAMQPQPGLKDVAIRLFGGGGVRPHSLTWYYVVIKNIGTDTLSGTYQLIKDTKLIYHPSATIPPSSISGDTMTWNYTNLAPWDEIWVKVQFDIPQNSWGQVLYNKAIATFLAGEADTTNNTSKLWQIIRGSYDPNDKSEAHGGKLTIGEAAGGQYLTYTIRFQNTGNDTAFNVHVRDTLSSKLDWTTLEMLASSHSFQMTMTDGRLQWNFYNINLVDSNKNEPASHGYLTYRIKPKSTIQIGDIITNRAGIYFDYNLPVQTNTDTTTIVSNTLPLQLLTFTARKEGKVNKLQWSTSNEVNVDRFEVERSENGREYSLMENGKLKTENGKHEYRKDDNSPLTHNYYRLKMIDREGSFTYSPIRIVNNSGSLDVSVYPNPVKDKLQVNVESDKKATLEMQVIAQDGKVMLAKQWNVNEGSGVKTINTSDLPKGSYFLKVTSQTASLEGRGIKFEKL